MTLTTIGDLAQNLVMRHRSVALKSEISALTNELSTGQVQDVSKRLGGDYTYLSDIERSLSRLDGCHLAASEAAVFTESTQTALGRLSDLSGDLAATALQSSRTELTSVRGHAAVQARSDLESAIGVLNGSAGGRRLFGGMATDRPPLASADTLLGSLKAEISGLTTTADIQNAIDNWFSDPAGFKSTMYAGSDNDLAPLEVGSGQRVSLSLRADDTEFTTALKQMAVIVLANDSDLGLSLQTQSELADGAAQALLNTQGSLAGLQSDLGFTEARIEEAATRNNTARTGLEHARSVLLEADPYEIASKLEQAQFQLESLYAVTVRTASLSLVRFMR